MLCKRWPQYFRSRKGRLRTYLTEGGAEIPEGIDPIVWERFVENESDPKKKKQNLNNADNRKQSPLSHSLGRCSYGQKAYKMKEGDSTKTFTRTDKWLMGHEDKNGECKSASAKPYYDKVKEASNKRKSVEDSSTTIEDDPVTEVFGSDKRGRVRGMGSHLTKKQVQHLSIADSKGASGKQGNEEIGATKDDLRVLVSEAVKGEMSAVIAELKRVFKDGSPLTRASGFTSHSVHQEINLNTNLDSVFSTIPPVVPNSDSPPVVLLNHQKKELAKGYVVTDATSRICHGKEVGVGEKKIYITEVIEPDARVYFSSDPNDTFAAYASGGYVVWVDSWIRYI